MAKAGSDYSPDLEFESPIQQQHGSKGLKIEIRFGDIFDSTADAIVVPEGTSFKQMGFVARHLTQIEPKYETIRKRLVKKNGSFTPWEVYTEKLGKMFQYVVCVIVPACDGDAEEWKQKFKLLYQRIFREADRKNISVVVIPLIGSGRGGARQEDAIEMAIASAFKFKGSKINKILFVSNDVNTVSLMASECRYTLGMKAQSLTQTRPQSSTHKSQSTRPSSSIPKWSQESPKNGTNDWSSRAEPAHTNVVTSLNSMKIYGMGFPPRDEVRGNKEREKRIRPSDTGVGDERNRSHGDHVTNFKFVQQTSSSRLEENKKRNRGGEKIPRTYCAEANAYQQQDKSFDAFLVTEEDFVGTSRDQERQTGTEKHRLRDRKSELTRINNALDDVGRYEEETYRDDVRMMYQMDRRPDMNRTNHLALHDDREGIVIGLEQKKRKKRIDNDERNSSHGDHFTVPSDLAFAQQNYSSRSEEIKEKNRGSQERQTGTEKHRLRDRKSELTRIHNALDDVGRYEEETYRDDVCMMNQMDRRSDMNRTNHLALHDDREGIVNGLQQTKSKSHLDKDVYDKYDDDDESCCGDVRTDGKHCHLNIDKSSQQRKLYGNRGMDANRSDVMQGNDEVLVDRSVKSTGEKFNLQATRNKGQKISENRVLGIDGQHGGMVSSETEMGRLNSGWAELSLKDSSIEALHSKLEHRESKYHSKDKARSKVHGDSLTNKSEENGHVYEVFGDVVTGAGPNQYPDDTNIHPDRETQKEINKSQCESDKQSCPICLEDMTDPKFLDKCGHVFCRGCIDNSFQHFKPVCPSCNMVYGILTGNQPDGNMDVGFSGDHLPGYEGHGTITITYYFPSGKQGGEHPNPGHPYKGTTRRAYLPDCSEGREVLRLLKTAFDRKLTFTIGRSTTTGQENVVTWNDIHHKTNMDGGPTRFGYPDPGYMTRVKEELASKGVTGKS